MKKCYLIYLVILICVATGCTQVTPISKEISLELGQTLSADPDQFVNVSDEKMLTEVVMDFSEIDFNNIGDYTANAVYRDKHYPISVHIQDTTPPDTELVANYRICALNVNVQAGDFFSKIEDKSETSVGIVNVQRVDDLELLTKVDLTAIEKPVANHDLIAETEFLETIQFAEEGKYLVKVAVKDKIENVTWYEVPVFVDGTVPVIVGAEDMIIITESLKNTPDYDLSHVKVTDNFDGDMVVGNGVIFEEEVTSSSDNVVNVSVHVYAVDRAGNKAEDTFEICMASDFASAMNDKNLSFELFEENAVAEVENHYDKNKAKEAFNLVNEQRTNQGLHPLTWDDSLYDFACTRAAQIVNDFSHYMPDGTYATDYLVYNIGGSNGFGENIAENYSSTSNLISGWMNSTSGHREAILNSLWNYGVMACYYCDGSYYWVNLFKI